MTPGVRQARMHRPFLSHAAMPLSVSTFLMFEGKAEEAMHLYVSLFPSSEIKSIERYGAEEDGEEGSVKRADFTVAGHPLVCIDSPVKHAFTFTPSVSLFVKCESEEELDAAYAKLSTDGQLLMPPGNYGFSRKFVWLNDRYGVSWQLNWE
jgi:predicted 3-demethylubiquinone-9 3-methyltransferase (glyoxalase superfamily)